MEDLSSFLLPKEASLMFALLNFLSLMLFLGKKSSHTEMAYDSKSFAEVIINIPQLKINFHFQIQTTSQRQTVRMEDEGFHII